MMYLGIKTEDLEKLGGIHTAREISQQPDLWNSIWRLLNAQKIDLRSFLERAKEVDKVILTGAGTSAFIGESLVGTFFRNYHSRVMAVPTTHLVSHPNDYLSKDEKVLLVSFARSGNSPESKAAVQLADKITGECYHLIITCNKEGDLAKYPTKNERFIFYLPEEANDKSLAMTSSYSGMLLSGLLISRYNELTELRSQVELASNYAVRVLTFYLQDIKDIASLPFKRAVFLGSGPLYGTANESHLKLQELTDGNIICKHDSFLGFRHGPKAVVDNETLIVYLLSNSQYVSKYENDLIFAMDTGKKAMVQMTISERMDFELPVQQSLIFASNGKNIDEDFLCLPAVLPAQILGFFKSINEGFAPDQPSSSGAISRVVQGVKIYDHNK